ncbi:MAG: HAD family phosphatase [Trueperaceae bacterium]|nr:MAG: HAD family phosphatase [Trueperaceae bacterium]
MTPTIQLIATDIDQTLLDHKQRLPHKNKLALQTAHTLGVRLVLASIRRRDTCLLVADELATPCYLISQGGAVVYHPDGSKLHECLIPIKHARSLATFADYARYWLSGTQKRTRVCCNAQASE